MSEQYGKIMFFSQAQRPRVFPMRGMMLIKHLHSGEKLLLLTLPLVYMSKLMHVLIEEKHHEKNISGMYDSINLIIPCNQKDNSKGYGIM